jgi:hypothetical protein
LDWLSFEAIAEPSVAASSAKKSKDKKEQSISIPSFAVIINDIRKQQFGSLFSSDDGAVDRAAINLILEHWSTDCSLLTAEDMVSQMRRDDGTISPSLMIMLAAHVDIRFFAEHWARVERALQNHLGAIVTCKGIYQGTSVFYWLCRDENGARLISARWDFFKRQIRKDMLHAKMTAVDEYQGSSPFYWLCSRYEGIKLMASNWSDFKKLIDRGSLCAPVTGNAPYKGMTPFYQLCAVPDGRQLIARYWSDFRACINKEVLGHSLDALMGPLYFLCGNADGRALLIKHWGDFKPFIDKSILTVRTMSEGPNKGTSPFYFLCGSLDGIQLLTTHWKDFKPFIDQSVLSAQALDGANKGTSPFYDLCDTEEGRALLSAHWQDFRLYIDKPMLAARVTANYSDEKGKSPFYLLCRSPDGRIILNKHWPDFRRHIDPSMLAACVTADNSADKGKNALYFLCNTPDEQNLLLEHWADFRTLIDSPMLAAQASNGGFQGISAFYALCSAGLALLKTHWNDFRPLLTKAMLSAQITGNDPEKGISPFFCLCSDLDGQEFLIENWADFKPFIDRKILTAKITGNGSYKGSSPADQLSRTARGQMLLKELSDLVTAQSSTETRIFSGQGALMYSKQSSDIALKLRKDTADPAITADTNYEKLVKESILRKVHLQKSSNGNTALHWAFLKNQTAKIMILLKAISADRDEANRALQISNTEGKNGIRFISRDKKLVTG